MGVVYRADDTRLNRPVALKFLPADSLNGEDRERFLREARAAAQIRHPNVCPVYDVEESDGRLFISMACLEGDLLSQRIARGRLEIRHAVNIAIQIAKGLDAAHKLGIVHRDIKSGNVIVAHDGHVSILDFGLAFQAGDSHLTETGRAMGTPAFMSPEQAQGLTVDHRTDVWSLGVVLYQMLTGVVPFRRDVTAAVVAAIVNSPAAPPSTIVPDIPASLDAIVGKALAKNADERWQTAREFELELVRFLEGRLAASTDVPTVSVALPEAMPAARTSRRKWLGVGTVAALLACAAGGYLATRALRGPALPSERLVAVLPFEAGSEDTRAVADGIVDVLTAALTEFERFQGKTAAIPSIELRRRGIATVEEARRQYGANLVVTGSVRPEAGKLRFLMNLVDAATVRQLASRSFDYDAANPVASRDRAVEQLTRLLQVNPVREARNAVSAGDSAAPAAYSAYLKGRGLMARYDAKGNLDRAIASFEEAVRQDPAYALAHASLGEAYWLKSRGSGGTEEHATQALHHAREAVRLDGKLATVHAKLGAIYGSAGRNQEAIDELRTALTLAPGSAEAHREMGRVYAAMGRPREAEDSYRKAVGARPTDWYGHLMLGLYLDELGRFPEAESALRRAQQLAPGNDIVCRNLGRIFRLQGRYAEAVEQFRESVRLKATARGYNSLGVAYYYQSRFEQAVPALETAIDLDPEFYAPWGILGSIHQLTPGNGAKARASFERAVELGERYLRRVPNDHDVTADVARYQAALGRHADALQSMARIPDAARAQYAAQLASALELSGRHEDAVMLAVAHMRHAATYFEMRDDPAKGALRADARVRAALDAGPPR